MFQILKFAIQRRKRLMRYKGSPFSRSIRRTQDRRKRLRIPRRPLRRPLHQPNKERHPQNREHNTRTPRPQRSRVLLRALKPPPNNRSPNRRNPSLKHQENHRRPRGRFHDAHHPANNLPRNNLQHRPHRSLLRRSLSRRPLRCNNDNAPLQRHAPTAPSQPGRLRGARHS